MPAHTWPLLYADAPATFAPCTLTPTEVPLLVRVTCTPTGDVLANDGTTTPTTAAALTPRMTRRRLTIGPSRTGSGSLPRGGPPSTTGKPFLPANSVASPVQLPFHRARRMSTRAPVMVTPSARNRSSCRSLLCVAQ